MQPFSTTAVWSMRSAMTGWVNLALFSILGCLCLLLVSVPSYAQATCATPYTVQPGDGWIKIANKCGITYEALRTANPDLWQQRQERLQVGDQLQLPPIPGISPTPTYPTPLVPTPLVPTPLSTITPTTLPTAPGITALETVRRFWLAVIDGLRTGDFWPAYRYLTPQQQSTIPYATFQASFATTRELTITSIAVVQESAGRALVDAVIVSADGAGVEWRYQHARYRFSLIVSNGLWRIESMVKLGVEPTPDSGGCTGAPPTRLQRGRRAYVLPQPPLPNRVFREPNRQSPLVGRIPPNTAMTLLDGPRCGQSSIWWYVQADNGVIGWTAEGQPGEYWLAPLASSGAPVVSPLVFCTQLDSANRCLAPTTQFPLGLQQLEVNWSFQNLPVNTPIKHLWYHKGTLFHQRAHVIWPANAHSTAGLGYTFYSPLGGLPTGEWRLEFRRTTDNLLLQTGFFVVGPSRRQ